MRDLLRLVRSQEQAHEAHVEAQQLQAPQVRDLHEGLQDQCPPSQTHGDTRRACEPARVQPLRLQSPHEALPEDPLHQKAHGGLQLQVRAVRQDVQSAVRLHDPCEGPRHGVLCLRHLRVLLSQQELPLLPQVLQAQDEGEEVPVHDLQEEVQVAEEPGQSHGAAQAQVRLRAVRHGVEDQVRPDQASQDPLGGEVLPLRDLRQNVRLPQLPEDPSADPCRGKALRLRHLRTELHAEVADDAASEEASWGASAASADQDHESAARRAGQNYREQERQVN